MCGLRNRHLKNISFSNVFLEVEGGVSSFKRKVREEPLTYPEVYTYGTILPASGIYFRYVDGLTLKDVRVETLKKDTRSLVIID